MHARILTLLAKAAKKEAVEKNEWDEKLLALSKIGDDACAFGAISFWVRHNLVEWTEAIDVDFPEENNLVTDLVVFLQEYFKEEIDELLVQISGCFTD